MLDIKINTKAIENEITEKVHQLTKDVLDKGINYSVKSYFASPSFYDNKKGGDGFVIIDDLVQKVLLSEDLQAKVTKAVMARMNDVISQSVNTALEHHINRTVWPSVQQALAPEQKAIMKDAIDRMTAWSLKGQ